MCVCHVSTCDHSNDAKASQSNDVKTQIYIYILKAMKKRKKQSLDSVIVIPSDFCCKNKVEMGPLKAENLL